MNIYVRQLAARFLPASVRMQLKKLYYPRVVKRFQADQWPAARIVKQLIQPGDHVVDAGANVGYITRLLSDWVGSTGRVHSIEPVPETFALLAQAVRVLGLPNVSLHKVGVSSADTEGLMETPRYPGGGENIYESRIVEKGTAAGEGRIAAVHLRRLDTLLGDDGRRVSFMKIDVEGHELEALQGASQMIHRAKPSLLIEVSGNPDDPASKASALFSILLAHGYTPYRLEVDGLHRRRAGDRCIDYFFLQHAHIKHVTHFLIAGE